MSLVRYLIKLLGSFWNELWSNAQQYIAVLRSYSALLGRYVHQAQKNILNSLAVAKLSTVRELRCTQLFLPVNAFQTAYIPVTWRLVGPSGSAEAPGEDDQSFLTIETQRREDGVQVCRFPVAFADTYACLFNSVQNTTRVLIKNRDYFIDNSCFYFRCPPNRQQYSTIMKIIDGVPTECYILWGITTNAMPSRDVFGYLVQESGSSPQIIKDVWEAQLRGPSVFAIKKIIGDSLDSPVAQDTEVVTEVRVVQGRHCVCTNKHCYSSCYAPVVSANETVSKGQLLFEGFSVYYTTEQIETCTQEELPSICVKTTVGVLQAKNEPAQYVHNLIPLQGAAQAAYNTAVLSAINNGLPQPTPPVVDQEGRINPMKYILSVLQRGRFLIVVLQNIASSRIDIVKLRQRIRRVLPLDVILYFVNLQNQVCQAHSTTTITTEPVGEYVS